MLSIAASTQQWIAPANSRHVAGSGKWGGRWSDGAGSAMGGTFGFAADDSSLAVLGAFTAFACVSGAPRE